MRVKCTGQIQKSFNIAYNTCINVEGDIEFCLSDDAFYSTKRQPAPAFSLSSDLPSEIEITGPHVIIPVTSLEFVNGDNTLSVNNKDGDPVLKISCTGSIKTDKCRNSPVSHCDIIVKGNMKIDIIDDIL